MMHHHLPQASHVKIGTLYKHMVSQEQGALPEGVQQLQDVQLRCGLPEPPLQMQDQELLFGLQSLRCQYLFLAVGNLPFRGLALPGWPQVQPSSDRAEIWREAHPDPRQEVPAHWGNPDRAPVAAWVCSSVLEGGN